MDGDMNEFRAGMIVIIEGKPQWGPGKIVHSSADGYLHIVFRDLEEQMARKFKNGASAIQLAPSQTDAILDNLPPLIERNGLWAFPKKRYSLESLQRKFLHEFPAGFADPKYFEAERDYKLAAHVEFEKSLGVDQAKQLLESGEWRKLGTKASSALSAINLVSPYECAAFSDAMKVDAAVEGFFSELMALLDTDIPEETVFTRFCDVVCSLPADRGRVATWPVATVFPYLARPDNHMFLKPEVTKSAAESLGFDLKYDPTPNWNTYDALLRMGRTYLELLRPLGARDFLDVQSFIYVSCGGYDSVRVRSKAARVQSGSSRSATRPYESVQLGYVNPNGQEVIRDTGERGSTAFSRKYELACHHCGQHYGANGFDAHERKCPNPSCPSGQRGTVGLTL